MLILKWGVGISNTFEEVCGKYDEKNPWILTKFHQEWFDLSENNNKTCIIASRDGKSVFYRVYFGNGI